jgi:hypothetical protein
MVSLADSVDSVYIYPLAVNLAAALLPIWAAHQVVKQRVKTGLAYPLLYWPGIIETEKEPEKYRFNCAQRAHQVEQIQKNPRSLALGIGESQR